MTHWSCERNVFVNELVDELIEAAFESRIE